MQLFAAPTIHEIVILYNGTTGNPSARLSAGGNASKQIGLIAQDVDKVLPVLVNTDFQEYKLLSYDKLTAVLVEVVKELKTENEKLRERVEQLERR